jgi:exopolysaccharide biosynthesis polyprenyl glycosylphosphotransferase
MNDRWSQIYKVLLLLGDFVALLVALIAAYLLRVHIGHKPLAESVYALQYVKVFLVILPIWLLMFAFLGLYRREIYESRLRQAPRLAVGSAIGMLLAISYQYFSLETIFPGHSVPAYGAVLAFGLLLFEREILRAIRLAAFRYPWGVARIMIIGNAETTKNLAHMLADTKKTGYKVVAIVGRKSSVPAGMGHITHFSSITNALKQLDRLRIDNVVQTEWYQQPELNSHIVEAVQAKHIDYKFIPTHNAFYTNSNTVELFHGLPTVNVHPTPLIGWGRIIKRAFDFVISLLGLVLLSWLFVLIAIAIKVTDPRGPVIFSQKRITRHGKSFRFYKFRSMKHTYSGPSALTSFKKMNRPDLVAEYEKYRKVQNDPRVTFIGKFLRATSLDELPQIWNICKGDISLVGPRAFLPEELELYKTSPLLLSVRTGLTGLWQVSGRSNLTFEQRLELELYYVQHWNFLLDLRIIMRTVWVVLFSRGAK